MRTSRRNKRTNADALSKQLRRRFYKGAAIATIAYVVLSLIRFHGQYSDLPSELTIIWAVFLLCYTTFKEVLRWSDVGDEEIYHGELWAGVMLVGAGWMIAWNIGRSWIFQLPKIPFPSDYESAVVETIVIYMLSILSSFLHKYRKMPRQSTHQKTYSRAIHSESKSTNMATNSLPLATSASAPAPSATVTLQDKAVNKPGQDSNVEVILTKASTLDEKTPPAHQDG